MPSDRTTAPQSTPITNAVEAGAWLEGLINHERRPGFRYERLGLEPICALLERLGHPERSLSILHVAGSKGKGSTCLFAEAILRECGETVGTFTSPHLVRWTERFRIDGEEVGEHELARAVSQVRPHVEALRVERPDLAPTFFDATTATALVLFQRARVDRAILEVGLGGRLDSTNAVTPAVTVVTHIELEHTDKLGDTLALIAGEKAGILKPGVPAIVGPLVPEAKQVVLARAEEVGAPLVVFGRDFEATPIPTDGSEEGQRFAWRGPDGGESSFVLAALGSHQVANAGLALAAVHALRPRAPLAVEAAAHQGLARARLPGRIELLGEAPWIVVDAAHTEASARSLARVLEAYPARHRHFVFSVSSDKDPLKLLSALVGPEDTLWLTRAEPVRSIDPRELARGLEGQIEARAVHCVDDVPAAVAAARSELSAEDLLCCTGSVYLAGAAREALSAE